MRRASGTPRVRMPTRATSSMPRFRSRISCAIRARLRAIRSASRTTDIVHLFASSQGRVKELNESISVRALADGQEPKRRAAAGAVVGEVTAVRSDRRFFKKQTRLRKTSDRLHRATIGRHAVDVAVAGLHVEPPAIGGIEEVQFSLESAGQLFF